MTTYNIITMGLTLFLSWSIINIVRFKQKHSFSKVIGSQKDAHELLKIIDRKESVKTKQKTSQMRKYEKDHMISVIVSDDYAYWVAENTFFVADIVDGTVDRDTTRPIDTNQMSIEEVKKMLSILDSLKGGGIHDSGSTRH